MPFKKEFKVVAQCPQMRYNRSYFELTERKQMFELTPEIKNYTDKAILLGKKDSKEYNNGVESDSFALGHMSAGIGYLLMDFKLNKRQLAELKSKIKELDKRLAE